MKIHARSLWWSVALVFLVLLPSCQYIGQKPVPYQGAGQVAPLDLSGYDRRVDNLLILLDDTASMDEGALLGSPKRHQSYAALERVSAMIPDPDLVRAVRIFGHRVDKEEDSTLLLHDMAQEEGNLLKKVVRTRTVENSIFDEVAMALQGGYMDLKMVEGRSAILILSDFTSEPQESLETAAMIKDYYQGRVCLYPVVVGSDPEAGNWAEELVAAAGCGAAARLSGLSDQQFGDFIRDMLYTKVTPLRAPIAMPAQEPAKPAESTSLSREKLLKEKKLVVELKTEFDFDKAVIRSQYHDHLREIAAFMHKYPDTMTTIEGHTCSIGTEEYNQKLSYQRAESVVQHLSNLGINSGRLAIKAYGETRPVADNTTKEGRYRNRRAVAVITTTVLENHKE